MSEETFPVTLAGTTWQVPHLPFRVLKAAQPRLMRQSRTLVGDDGGQGVALRLDEATLDDLGEVAFLCCQVADPTLSREAFFNLPFGTGELLAALPSFLRACGLETSADAGGEGEGEKK